MPRSLRPFAHGLRCLLCGLILAAGIPAFTATTEAPEPRKVSVDGEALPALGFDKLSAFPYTIVDAGTGATPEQIAEARKRDQVPATIRAYQDKRVVLSGYLMPLQVENGLSKKMVLMKDINTCCYGAMPNMNDYVVVTMKGPGVKAVQDIPVELVGVLRIEEKYENGYVTSLFQLDGEKFLGAQK